MQHSNTKTNCCRRRLSCRRRLITQPQRAEALSRCNAQPKTKKKNNVPVCVCIDTRLTCAPNTNRNSIPISGRILDEDSEVRVNERLAGEKLVCWWTDSINPLTLDTLGDLNGSDVATHEGLAMDDDCSWRSNFFTQPKQTLLQISTIKNILTYTSQPFLRKHFWHKQCVNC